MSEKKFTKGEALIVMGKVMQKAGEEWDDDGKLDQGEIINLIQTAILEAVKEYNDWDTPLTRSVSVNADAKALSI